MFYSFRQNNSGGSFRIDPDLGISVDVIIEADSAREANSKADWLGIYFNGCNRDLDCSCCGDRWYPVDESEAQPVPSFWGDPIHAENAYISTSWAAPSPEGFIHYADGHMEAIWAGDPKKVDGVWWDACEAVVTAWPLEEAELITMELAKGATRAIAA